MPAENPREDVIVSFNEVDPDDPHLVLGTSSIRRTALLKHFYPHIKTIMVRGNLQTRVEKLKNGAMHGLVLAYAGVRRMHWEDMVKYRFDMEQLTPPVGQGAIAIESHGRLTPHLAAAIKSSTNHELTEQLVRMERAFLRRMEGGCSIPVFGHAQLKQNGEVAMTGGIVSPDGQRLIRKTVQGLGTPVGESLAVEILRMGGRQVLDEIGQSG